MEMVQIIKEKDEEMKKAYGNGVRNHAIWRVKEVQDEW